MTYSKEQTAENLRVLRARRKMSGKEVSDAIGVAGPSLSLWENGTNNMTLENACKVADFYGVSLDELVGRS